MTITTYTDREIALKAQLASMTEERDTLRQQLAEAQALIEASRKQEPITKVSTCATLYQNRRFSILGFTNSPLEIDTPLYAAPVVADDVLKDALRYRWLRDSDNWPEEMDGADAAIICGYAGHEDILSDHLLDAAIDAAMGGAA